MDSKKIYVGNLDSSIDEYAVLKLCEPFGKITSLDYMFHLHGPKKGQPRGYCFIEYENKKDSLKAISALHGKRIKARNLVVSMANKSNKMLEELKRQKSQQKPSAFNTIRKQKMTNTTSTDARIQAIEEKLAALKKNPTTTTATKDTQSTTSTSLHRYKPY